jgi:hypothetical protein
VPDVIKEEVKKEGKEGNNARRYATPPHRIHQECPQLFTLVR